MKKTDCSKMLSGVGSQGGNSGGNWVTGQGEQNHGTEEQVCSGDGLSARRSGVWEQMVQ